MAHHIYTTPGFLVHSSPHSEAGKFFLVFTRELGMLGCVAQGVRLSQSKLRYYTQDYSYSLFSLVRGKDVWRMTGAKEIEGIGEIKEENKKLWVQILALLRRLLHGEEQNEKLFEIINNFYNFLTQEVKEKELVEYLIVFRVLNSLGYISNTSVFFDLISTSEINEQVLKEMKENKDQILKEINNGLKESQL
jgi:DNA repair protein RecO